MGCHNFTGGNETLSSRTLFSLQTSVPLTILVGVLISLTVFGNVLVVIAVITSRALRAPQNLFLVSLACADILVATSVMPFSLANELMGYWYFGKVWCEIYLALDVLFCTSSIVHLCAISLDRYWSVTRAVEHNLRRTPRQIKCAIFIVWVLAAIISFPPLITMEKEEGKEDRPTCQINKERWYIIFSSVASFFAPCVIMIMVYVRIYQIAMRRTRAPPGGRQRGNGNTEGRKCDSDHPGRKDGEGRGVEVEGGEIIGVDGEGECSSSDVNETTLCSLKKKRGARNARATAAKPGETSPKADVKPGVTASRWRGRQHRERRFTLALAVVMGVFVLCWFPFFFTYTLTAVCDSCCVPETAFKMFFWLGYCNSSLNPVIYTIFNNDFRSSFKRILCKLDRRGL